MAESAANLLRKLGTAWHVKGKDIPTDLGYRSGAGSPVGTVTPDYIGQEYYDTNAETFYRATFTTSGDWVEITGDVGAGISTLEITPERFRHEDDPDDTASFLRAVAYFNTGPGKQAGGTIVCRGGYTISDTILVSSLGITFKGDGWGNSTVATSGTWIKWAGPAGRPMIKFLQTWNAGIDNIRLIGNTLARPSAAIEFADIQTDAFVHSYLNRVWIGNVYGYDTDYVGNQFDNGIVASGIINGDGCLFNHVVIHGCENVGFDIQNPNFTGTVCNMLEIYFCDVCLKVNGASILINYCFFAFDSDSMILLKHGARVHINDFNSEKGRRLARFDDASQVAKLVLHDGGFQVQDQLASDGRWIDTSSSLGWLIHLENFWLQTLDTFTGPRPRLRAYNTSGGLTNGTLILRGVRGIYPSGLELGTVATENDQRNIIYEPHTESAGDLTPRQSWQGSANDGSDDQVFRVFASDAVGEHKQRGGPFVVKQCSFQFDPGASAQLGSGATSYSYKVVAETYDGHTLATGAATCTNAAALDSTHVNRVIWNYIRGAKSYKVYGRTSGSELLLATVTWDSFHGVAPLYGSLPRPRWDDDGSVTPSGALPTANTTGNLTVEGKLSVGTASNAYSQIHFATGATPTALANGDMWFDGGFKARIGGATNNVGWIQITQAAYDVLTPNASTLYVIVG